MEQYILQAIAEQILVKPDTHAGSILATIKIAAPHIYEKAKQKVENEKKI